jgi:hypothetical protein
MGLYQYIREQEHRNDLVGELGRWMSKHYGERPDHNSLAFELASQEFDACRNWTRQDALGRLNENKRLQHILKIEPRINGIISELLKMRATRGYRKEMEYSRLKAEVSKMVGYSAEIEELGDSDSYQIILQVIIDLLPPDATELYPSSLPEEIELDL